MIGWYLRRRLRKNKTKLSGVIALLDGLSPFYHPDEYHRARADLKRLRCQRERIIALLVAHGGRGDV